MWVYNYLNKIINNKTSSHRVGKLYLELIKDLYCEYTSNIFTKNKRTKQLQIKKANTLDHFIKGHSNNK